jgi:hypothetical protein
MIETEECKSREADGEVLNIAFTRGCFLYRYATNRTEGELTNGSPC